MKTFCAILFSFVLIVVLALPAAAEGESAALSDTAPALTAPAAYVVNLDTNIVVYDKNSEVPLSAASLTKMMTTLLLLESYQDQLDSISLTAPSYIYDLIWEQSTNASTADISRGETHSRRNLLYAMLLPSGNEAAYIVADYMGGGSIDNFVAMMNNEAAAIGCTGTTFVDPCGLNPNNITTARDAYLILRALTAYDVFATVAGTPTYDMGTNSRYTTPGTYILQNTDKLITNSSYHRDYTKGGKTGSLGEWQNFAGWHSQDGESYISVVLNVPMESDEGGRPALLETGTLMDWVFATYTIAPALDPTQPITEVRVAYSTQADTVMLYPVDNMMTLLPREAGSAARPHPAGRCRGHRDADHSGRDHRYHRPDRGQRCLPQSAFVYAVPRAGVFFQHVLQGSRYADNARHRRLSDFYRRPHPAYLEQGNVSRINGGFYHVGCKTQSDHHDRFL